jgi:hypothetical protein
MLSLSNSTFAASRGGKPKRGGWGPYSFPGAWRGNLSHGTMSHPGTTYPQDIHNLMQVAI